MLSRENVEFEKLVWEPVLDCLDRRLIVNMPDETILDACPTESDDIWTAQLWRPMSKPNWPEPIVKEKGLRSREEAQLCSFNMWKVYNNERREKDGVGCGWRVSEDSRQVRTKS